jgi:hypothetical protein
MTQPTTHTTPVATPDAKDWTWVLRRPCPDCGVVSAQVTRQQVGALLQQAAAALAAELDRPDAPQRPTPDVWSPLEYACHVRDVCRTFGVRLARILAEDDPGFANWDQDTTAVDDDYASQDPQQVRADLLAEADVLAAAFGAVPDDAWDRTGRRSDGARFTVLTLGQYLVHDPMHHVWDVTGRRQG